VARFKNQVTPVIDQRWFIRFLEIFPGLTSWGFLALPIVLSIVYPVVVAYFIVAFDLYWLIKSLRLSTYLIRGYIKMRSTEKIDWRERLDWLEDPEQHLKLTQQQLSRFLSSNPSAKYRLQLTFSGWRRHWRYRQLVERVREMTRLKDHQAATIKPQNLINAVILTTYNESYEVLESTVGALLKVNYPYKQMVFIIAYEERGGQSTADSAHKLINQFGKKFLHAEAIMHPDGIPGEIRGKGGNITFAGRQLAQWVEQQAVDPERVIVTTLDADNRPSREYFANLSYTYASDPNRVHRSYQPTPMFNNNIWDVPAPMRVIATSNSFWQIMETMRPYRLRNFSSHAQSLKALIATDFWSVTTPVEDGHQYWRSYFTFDGDYKVDPIFVPIYQDAVLDDTYIKTFRAQFIQLRRWAYGASDFQFAVRESIRNDRAPLLDKLVQLWRLFEGHFSWATAALLITFVAWLPLYLNHRFSEQVLAHQLPIIASRMMNIALVGAIATIAISMLSLPPRPPGHSRHRNIFMILQWVLLPITGIVFSSFAALNAQTRLMFGRYLGFDVTKKSRRRPPA
jgi:hypothetical protein